jgi:hypothetical protein
MKELLSCEQRYWHRKINNTPVDSDYQESDSLGLGKAFHQVLEKTKHTSWDEKLLIEAMGEHGVEIEDADLLRVMLTKYLEYRKLSGFKVVFCELAIVTSSFRGYLDYIATKDGKFYIGDLKTAARFDEKLIPRLALDPQLNLYAHFKDDIEIAVPEVKGLEFGGCLYTQIIKSKAGTAAGLERGVKVYETLVPASAMDPDTVWSLFEDAHNRSLELRKGEVPKRNYSSCFNYFNFCPHFSACHGEVASKAASKVIVNTIETLKDGELL